MTSPLLTKILAILAHHGHHWQNGAPPSDLRIERTRAGAIQRSEGAWSWYLRSNVELHAVVEIGSQWPASEIARLGPSKTTLYQNEFGQICIHPVIDRAATQALFDMPTRKRQRVLCCPKCGGKGPLSPARAQANGGTLRNDSLWQGQSICARCADAESVASALA